jgi:hypothetical protein
MKFLIAFVIVLVTGCSNSAPLPTIEELINYPLSCKKKHEQYRHLADIQKRKNFSENPDNLSPQDRQYNSVLREHLWWFVYNCEQ